MMIKHRSHPGSRREKVRLARWALALAVLPLLGLAACDFGRILEVDDPDVVLPPEVEGPTTLPAVRAHAIGEFAVAYSANPGPLPGENPSTGQILLSGLLADEFIHTGTFDTRESIDRRIVAETNPHVQESFLRLHRARVAAERAADLFGRFDANTAAHAEMLNLAGYTYLMFAENYCAGVPFSRILPDGSFEFGEPETTTQVFQRAISRFDAALAAATGSADQENLARLGRARALLGLGQYAQAAAAAAAVPTGFEYVLFHSEATDRQNNGVWSFNNSQGRWSVADREGGNGLPFRSRGNIDGEILDPRIPSVQIGFSQRSGLRARGEHWGQLKYPERTSGTVLAAGIEARLIEAEAALDRGNSAAYLGTLNTLREGVGLGPLMDPGNARGRVDQFFAERAYWLWLTSRRLGDLRRLMWDYGRQQGEIFPVGSHHRAGAPYGTDTSFPIPFDEQNNPRAVQCITRDDAAGRQ
jgi:starch-binding outer membrane protein, SusD/RagB family